MALSSHARRLTAHLGAREIPGAAGRHQERGGQRDQADQQAGDEDAVQGRGLSRAGAQPPGHDRAHDRHADCAADGPEERISDVAEPSTVRGTALWTAMSIGTKTMPMPSGQRMSRIATADGERRDQRHISTKATVRHPCRSRTTLR